MVSVSIGSSILPRLLPVSGGDRNTYLSEIELFELASLNQCFDLPLERIALSGQMTVILV